MYFMIVGNIKIDKELIKKVMKGVGKCIFFLLKIIKYFVIEMEE